MIKIIITAALSALMSLVFTEKLSLASQSVIAFCMFYGIATVGIAINCGYYLWKNNDEGTSE